MRDYIGVGARTTLYTPAYFVYCAKRQCVGTHRHQTDVCHHVITASNRLSTEGFPCLSRHGPIEAQSFGTCLARVATFRAYQGTAPLKPYVEVEICKLPAPFRAYQGTAPLKQDAVHSPNTPQTSFPCLSRHGPIEAVFKGCIGVACYGFPCLSRHGPIEAAGCFPSGPGPGRAFRAYQGTAPLKRVRPLA